MVSSTSCTKKELSIATVSFLFHLRWLVASIITQYFHHAVKKEGQTCVVFLPLSYIRKVKKIETK